APSRSPAASPPKHSRRGWQNRRRIRARDSLFHAESRRRGGGSVFSAPPRLRVTNRRKMKTPRGLRGVFACSENRSALLAALGVDGFAQILAGFEADVLRSRNVDLFIRARIAALARLPLGHGKAAEARNRAALAALTTARNVAYERVERGRCFLLGNPRL